MTRRIAKNDIFSVRVLGSEGNYHVYRLLRERRLFLAAKLAGVTYKYWRGAGQKPRSKQIALIKGSNQLRHHKRSLGMSEARLGKLEAFSDAAIGSALPLLPRIGTGQSLLLLLYALRVLCLGRRRDLSLFLLAFYQAARRIADSHLSDIRVFVCYNDQPFDVAAFVHALNKRGDCRTIVVQHGLILSESFYFPTIAREFWAWGALSRESFRTRHPEGILVEAGRYDDDLFKRSSVFKDTVGEQSITALLAFSFFHNEIEEGLNQISRLRSTMPSHVANRLQLGMKLHPALKNQKRIRSIVASQHPWISIVEGDMEDLAEDYDCLLTLNSTSAVDFLLRGKAVYFLAPSGTAAFPSLDYGFAISEFPVESAGVLTEKNQGRLAFLKKSLNV